VVDKINSIKIEEDHNKEDQIKVVSITKAKTEVGKIDNKFKDKKHQKQLQPNKNLLDFLLLQI